MDFLFTIAAPLIVAAAAWVFFRYVYREITVLEWQRGLLYRKGVFQRVVGPGKYRYVQLLSRFVVLDARPTYETVSGQELLSADAISIKLSVVAAYRIADAAKAMHETRDYRDALHNEVQIALREIVGGETMDNLLQQRTGLSTRLLESTKVKTAAFGLEVTGVRIKDIIFPGSLKETFARVLQAQKEGQAALERARGESAALRNLANAAKMLESNPALMQLRLLQTLDTSTGNTFVLGVPQAYSIIPGDTK